MRMQPQRDRGSSAVEFALIVPVLLSFVFGIIEYGNYFKIVNQADSSAMVGARSLALNSTVATAQAAALAAAGSSFTASDFAATTCTTTNSVAVITVAKPYAKLFGIIPTPSTINAKAAVRCES